MKCIRMVLIGCLAVALAPPLLAQSAARQWSDASGKFKVSATLERQDGGFVYLKTTDGRSLRIPIDRLCEADKAFLKEQEEENPFEELDSGAMAAPAAAGAVAASPAPVASASRPAASAGSAAGAAPATPAGGQSVATAWDAPLVIDWNDVPTVNRSFSGDSWDVQVPAQTPPKTADKRAPLNPKTSVHEKLKRFVVNPRPHRAVVGYTMSFSSQPATSRLALIDFASAKSIHTDPLPGEFEPIGLLNDGGTTVMRGATFGGRNKGNGADELQLWRVAGKTVDRSATWVPFVGTEERFGRIVNPEVAQAIPMPGNRLVLRSNKGHLTSIDVVSRQPHWFMKLGSEGAIDVTPDQSLLAVLDGSTLLVIDPQQGVTKGSVTLEPTTGNHFPRVAWNPSCSQIAVIIGSTLWLIDSDNGNVAQQFHLPEGANANGGMAFPHPDYLLLNGSTLFHIPSQLMACQYSGATLQIAGGICYIAIEGRDGGLVTDSTLPHPAVGKLLDQAASDPSVFLIHPGVKVAIDASGAGQYASEVTTKLTAAAKAAGYEVVPQSDITLVATITGPTQKAVSYIAAGSYVVNVHESQLAIRWNGVDLWKRNASNMPGSLFRVDREKIQEKLDELTKKPNMSLFSEGSSGLPKVMQRPRTATQASGQPVVHHGGSALISSQFTMSGLVDTK